MNGEAVREKAKKHVGPGRTFDELQAMERRELTREESLRLERHYERRNLRVDRDVQLGAEAEPELTKACIENVFEEIIIV